jgi:hypothetical protein
MTRVARRVCIGVVVAGFAVLAAPRSAAAEECRGVAMPAQIDVGGKRLVLNGMGVREATVMNVDVYVAGLYLTTPTRYASGVLQSMNTMRLVLVPVRDVERGEMSDALRKGLERNAGDQMPALEEPMAALEKRIPDLAAGDTIGFTYFPEDDGWLAVDVNGVERGRLPGMDFAQVFFSIWLNNPPNEGLKTGLLGGECD